MHYERAVKILSPTIFAIWAITEAPRLLFGYTGNLKEKVPQMASFVLLTLFPSLPALCYFLFAEVNKTPLDWALHVIQFGITLAELFVGRRALSVLIRSQRDRCESSGRHYTFNARLHAAAMAQSRSGSTLSRQNYQLPSRWRPCVFRFAVQAHAEQLFKRSPAKKEP